MSHSVTIRTTTTTTGGSTIILNTSYLKTLPGILKLLEVLLGIACVGIAGHDFNYYGSWNTTAKLFYLLMVTTFLIASFILLISCLASLSTGPIISKTIYEVIFHSIGFGLLLAASLTLLVEVNRGGRYRTANYEALFAAAIIGLVNAALYLVSTILALRSYRGL
ncbi:uncharacterized protein LOC105693766 [Athalia rosae]|uniref:uncharacterized protein LOC105693766 n=1 Tax=Athalia rosae TaxID=37344 RepID=UPI0006250A8B|nr:uncharacterized protein LOC105693766 [Athalia rosae]XP_048510539.1 uncharacterized protein LOC105693766 [Athalia rosae]